MTKPWRFTGFCLVLVAVLAGCSSKTEQTVGAVLALTGAGQTYAQDIRRGIELELEGINADGGIDGLPMRVMFEDSRSEPATARSAAERLIQENRVPAIIGGVLSSETLAIAPLVQESKTVLLSPASSSPDITGSGSYIFRIYPSDVVEGTMVADFVLNVLQKSRIMIIAINNDYGKGLKGVFARRYRSVPNREILDVLNFEQGQDDWSQEIARIRELMPDAIYLVGYPLEMLGFLEALDAEKVEIPIVASRSFDVEILKDPAAEGVIFPRDPFDEELTDAAAEFARKYRAKYSAEPNIWAANGRDAVRLLAEAMRSVGDRSEEIKNWLSSMPEFQGASGILSFDRQGDVGKYPVLSIVHNGEFIDYKTYQELPPES